MMSDYIDVDMKDIETFVSYKGRIIKSKTEMAKICGVSRPTIYKWLKEDNEKKFKKHGMEIIYAKKTSNGRFWICSDGEIRNQQFESIKKHGKSDKTMNSVVIKLGSKRAYYGVANLIYKTFVDPTHRVIDKKDEDGNIIQKRDSVLFLDNDYNNCRLDNLVSN